VTAPSNRQAADSHQQHPSTDRLGDRLQIIGTGEFVRIPNDVVLAIHEAVDIASRK